jgi:Rrf2 family protein
MIELASHPIETPLALRAIAAKHRIPQQSLEIIFTALQREGIVESTQGGFVLTRVPSRITVLEIISVVEGEFPQQQRETSIDENLIEQIWQQANQAARSVLEQYTLQDLCHRHDF